MRVLIVILLLMVAGSCSTRKTYITNPKPAPADTTCWPPGHCK